MTQYCRSYQSYCFKGFLKSLTPNDENEVCLNHALLSKRKKKQLQIMDTAHANVTAVTNNQ